MTQRDNNSDRSAAAVEPKTEEKVKEFSALGVDPEVIRPHVKKDPVQADNVLAILRARSKRPPETPTGFALTAFKERWSGPAPPQPVKDARPIIAEIERQRKCRDQAGPVSLKALLESSR